MRVASSTRRRVTGKTKKMKPFRKEKVASLIRRVIGEAILHQLTDPRIELLTTVSRVEVTSDLQIARIYLNVPGGDAVERRTMSAIESARGLLQRVVAANLTMRHCPQLVFAIDELNKRAMSTLELIEANRREREAVHGADEHADSETGDETDIAADSTEPAVADDGEENRNPDVSGEA